MCNLPFTGESILAGGSTEKKKREGEGGIVGGKYSVHCREVKKRELTWESNSVLESAVL